MPRVLRSRKGRESDYFDRKNGKTCLVVKAVDVTDLCPRRSGKCEVRIEYLQDSRGRQFVLRILSPGSEAGLSTIFPLDTFDPDQSHRPGFYRSFRMLADACGLTFARLWEIVQAHAPPKAKRPLLGTRAAARIL